MELRKFLYHPVTGKSGNMLIFIVSLVPACVFFTFPVSIYTFGIDPPLSWVFNYIFQQPELGKYIVFPHGPLAFLMYPLPFGPNIWISVLFHLGLRILLAYSIMKLASRKAILSFVLAFVAAVVLLVISDLLLTLIQVIILCYLNFFDRRNVTWLIPALILTPFALLIKAFVGIASILITLCFAGIMIYRSITGTESRYRLLLLLIVPFVFLLIWFGLYGDLNGITGFLKGMSELAADNSAAVAFYPPNNWLILGLAMFSGLLMIVFGFKDLGQRRFVILILPALFAIWKYGMAREDYLHNSVLFVFIFFVSVIFTILATRVRFLTILLPALVIGLFYANLRRVYFYEPFQVKANGVQALVSGTLNSAHFADTCRSASEKLIARNKLDQSLFDIIGNSTVDIYPWDYSYIPANKLNWKPRPVIQSYAAYTRELDQLNSQHFSENNSPEFIVWQIRKITHDIHGGTLESIDGRYLLNDEPDALLSMFSNYELVAAQGGDYPVRLYRKRPKAILYESKVAGHSNATWNKWINVPKDISGILRASVTMERNLTGTLKSIFYKDELVQVYYLLSNGDVRAYRVVPKNAAYGLWINPLIINPELKMHEPEVVKIMFTCSGKAMMKEKLNISWNEIQYTETSPGPARTDSGKDIVFSFFGIRGGITPDELLVSVNNLETNNRFWSEPAPGRLQKTGENHELIVSPGEYSVSFQYPLDTLTNIHGSQELIVHCGIWIKAPPQSESLHIISVEKDGKSLIWKAVQLKDFINDGTSYFFVPNFAVLSQQLLCQKGLVLKVYAWNTGDKSLLVDDLSVRIEIGSTKIPD